MLCGMLEAGEREDGRRWSEMRRGTSEGRVGALKKRRGPWGREAACWWAALVAEKSSASAARWRGRRGGEASCELEVGRGLVEGEKQGKVGGGEGRGRRGKARLGLAKRGGGGEEALRRALRWPARPPSGGRRHGQRPGEARGPEASRAARRQCSERACQGDRAGGWGPRRTGRAGGGVDGWPEEVAVQVWASSVPWRGAAGGPETPTAPTGSARDRCLRVRAGSGEVMSGVRARKDGRGRQQGRGGEGGRRLVLFGERRRPCLRVGAAPRWG